MSDLDLIARREHPDPHQVLGAHPSNGGVVVRAFRPAAEKVVARVDGGEPVQLEQSHPAGVFEGQVDGAELPLRYELEVSYPDGNTFTLLDPYSFPPTVGELDVHLAGEGRHEEIYERLGAHVRELEGVTGTSFAVWAPSARAVSVVGDFNSWDGRLHPMRSLGASGIWEIFLPGVEEGAAYKYEILTQSGEIRMKADPFAFASQHPPRTDSVVHRPRHTLGRRRLAGAPPRLAPVRGAGVDLRGAPRLLAVEPAGGQPLALLRGAGRRAGRLRDRHGLHARGAAAGDGAPVLGLVGLSGVGLLRPDRAPRHARTTSARSWTACTRPASA